MGRYHTPEHFGTHLDAPIHSPDNQPSVHQLTAYDLFGPAVLNDVEENCTANADYLLTTQDLLNWEKEHGNIPDGAIVIMSTAWGKKWDNYEAYKQKKSLDSW